MVDPARATSQASGSESATSTGPARFGLVGACSLGVVVWIIAGPRSEVPQLLGVVLLTSALFLLVVWSARFPSRAMRRCMGGTAIVASLAVGAIVFDTPGMRISTLAIVLAVGIACPLLLGVALVRRRAVDIQLLLGAISIYLMLGLSFAMAYAIVGQVQATPLFVGPDGVTDGSLDTQLYFSFITMSTTGYGDYTPHSGTARAFAIVEALGGQLYLLTTVASIVGLLTMRDRSDRFAS